MERLKIDITKLNEQNNEVEIEIKVNGKIVKPKV